MNEPTNAEEYDLYCAEEERLLNLRNGVVQSSDDLIGWRIIHMERYKPGVVRFTATKGNTCRTGFAKDEMLSAWQLPP